MIDVESILSVITGIVWDLILSDIIDVDFIIWSIINVELILFSIIDVVWGPSIVIDVE